MVSSQDLPFLQERHKIVDCQHGIRNELIDSHIDISDGDSHAKDLFEL